MRESSKYVYWKRRWLRSRNGDRGEKGRTFQMVFALPN